MQNSQSWVMKGAMCRTSRNCVDSALSHSPKPSAVAHASATNTGSSTIWGAGVTP